MRLEAVLVPKANETESDGSSYDDSSDGDLNKAQILRLKRITTSFAKY